jgi:hypothetical protein
MNPAQLSGGIRTIGEFMRKNASTELLFAFCSELQDFFLCTESLKEKKALKAHGGT